MPTEVIPIGQIVAMTQNTAYALPAVQVSAYTDATTPTAVQSNTVAFTATTTVTFTAGVANLNGGFLKATSAGVNIILRRQ